MYYVYVFLYCLSCIFKENFRSGIFWFKNKCNVILLDMSTFLRFGYIVLLDNFCLDNSE